MDAFESDDRNRSDRKLAAVAVAGFLRDSVISNVVNLNPDCTALRVDRPNGFNNVLTTNLLNTQK